MEKRRSVIEKIKLNTPTYNGVEFTPSYINFFFGRNGAGKSTIAYEIASDSGLEWKSGFSADNFNVLVYNQDFINENFDNFDDLAGVFTLSKVNIETQKKIAALAKEKEELLHSLGAKNVAIDDKKAAIRATEEEAQTQMYKLTESVRAKFDAALQGRKQKRTFCTEVITKAPCEHSLDEIEELYTVAYDKAAASYQSLKSVSPIVDELESLDLEILHTAIVSTSETSFAKTMKKIGNSDWVKEGYFKYSQAAEGLCPFCQKPLAHDFEEEIMACFDEQYQEDIALLKRVVGKHKELYSRILQVLQENMTNEFPRADFSLYKEKVERLKLIFQTNEVELKKKEEHPSDVISLESVDDVIDELEGIIADINRAIKQNNDAVAAKKETKAKCDRILWEHLAFMIKDEDERAKSKISVLNADISAIEEEKKQIRADYSTKEEQIRAESQNTVNTDDAFESINAMLIDSGFQGFSLRKKPGVKNRYEVVRDGDKPVKRLSEGERNFIAFLYFYHLVRGSGRADSAIISANGDIQDVADNRDKIVVIDDPVSSMDSGTLFIVSSMVREMINICHNNVEMLHPETEGSFIKQIFILTHNAYFHREVTYNQVDFYDRVNFYMVRKSENNSSISLCVEKAKELSQSDRNINPVQNAYTALWTEYKELTSTIPLLNVIRRILEYYFMELCGYQGAGIRETILKKNKSAFIKTRPDGSVDDTDYHLAYSMLSYIDNDCSFIDGFNLVQDSVDAEQYRAVLKKIFEKLEQGQHYKMMCGD